MFRGDDGRTAGGESKFGDLGPIKDLRHPASREGCGLRYMLGVIG